MASSTFWGRSKSNHKRALSLDNVDAADMIQKEKLARQLATRLASIERPSDCPLFEHFLVFGQSNLKSEDVKATCIFKYPVEKPILLQALEQFVFPTGMPAERDLSRTHASVLDFHAANPQNSFTLLLTTSIKEVFYAICVVDEYLKPYPTFVEESGQPTLPKLMWNARCYCLITRYPLFDLMFEVLLHLLDVEEKSLTLPVAHRSGELNQVNRILSHLWKIPAPKPGAILNLGIPRISSYSRPMQHEDEKLISSYCVPTLFWALDKDTILTLVAAALLERKLLFVSANLHLLTNCILSFVALLKPFVLQCVFIPVLPDNLLQIAEAPVPFIAGLANPKLTRLARLGNPEIIVVDLTARRIVVPKESTVPPLPNIRGLSHAIDPYVVQLKRTFDKYTPPYKATKAQRDYVTEMLRLLEQYITPYFEAFRRHCITSLTDNVTIFVKETYLIEETDATSIEFFQPFLETQIFSHWCDLKLKEIDRLRQRRYGPPQGTRAAAAEQVDPSGANHSTSTSAPQIVVSSTQPAPVTQSQRFISSPGIRRPRSASNNADFVASLQFSLADETEYASPRNNSASPSSTPSISFLELGETHIEPSNLAYSAGDIPPIGSSDPAMYTAPKAPLASSDSGRRPKSASVLASLGED